MASFILLIGALFGEITGITIGTVVTSIAFYVTGNSHTIPQLLASMIAFGGGCYYLSNIEEFSDGPGDFGPVLKGILLCTIGSGWFISTSLLSMIL